MFVPSFMKRLRGIPGRVQSSSRRPSGTDLTPVAKITATKTCDLRMIDRISADLTES